MFDQGQFEKIKEKVKSVHDGRAGRWFDPGEYEYLKQEFFDEQVPVLISMIEDLKNQLDSERHRPA